MPRPAKHIIAWDQSLPPSNWPNNVKYKFIQSVTRNGVERKMKWLTEYTQYQLRSSPSAPPWLTWICKFLELFVVVVWLVTSSLAKGAVMVGHNWAVDDRQTARQGRQSSHAGWCLSAAAVDGWMVVVTRSNKYLPLKLNFHFSSPLWIYLFPESFYCHWGVRMKEEDAT